MFAFKSFKLTSLTVGTEFVYTGCISIIVYIRSCDSCIHLPGMMLFRNNLYYLCRVLIELCSNK